MSKNVACFEIYSKLMKSAENTYQKDPPFYYELHSAFVASYDKSWKSFDQTQSYDPNVDYAVLLKRLEHRIESLSKAAEVTENYTLITLCDSYLSNLWESSYDKGME